MNPSITTMKNRDLTPRLPSRGGHVHRTLLPMEHKIKIIKKLLRCRVLVEIETVLIVVNVLKGQINHLKLG